MRAREMSALLTSVAPEADLYVETPRGEFWPLRVGGAQFPGGPVVLLLEWGHKAQSVRLREDLNRAAIAADPSWMGERS